LHLTWLERIWQMPERVLRNAVTFLRVNETPSSISADADALGWDAAELNVLEDTLKVFTLWLGAFEQVQARLPLKAGMFDLVIIDNAELVDLPAAMGLLFRGKRALIVGHPGEIKRMTWISRAEEHAFAKENGIAHEAFSFKRDSLLDLARRNLKDCPAVFTIGEVSETSERTTPIEISPAVTLERFTLPGLLDSCHEFIWWFDPAFTNEVVTLFWDLLQQEKVIPLNEIRLLISREQVETPEALHPNSLNAIRAEMDDFGIQFEMRMLPKAELPVQRFFFSSEHALVMPEFNQVFQNRHLLHDFIQLASSSETFEPYWGKAKPVF